MIVTTNKPFSASHILGGVGILHARPHTAAEWIELVRKGIPAGAVDAVMQTVGVQQTDLASALAIPERTLVRRKKEGILNQEESGKLVRLARVVERAAEVFEELPLALGWIKSANASLGGVAPLSLLDTELGAHAVMESLGKIEQGIFA